jgi:hypothetical protein
MAEPVQTLTFLSYVREQVSGLVTGRAGGRGQGRTTITLTATAADQAVDEATRELRFLVAGPADVTGLRRGAVIRRYPAPGARDHESDRCPYVELAEPSLPWRYTHARTPDTGGASIHPWFVLVVGVDGAEIVVDGDSVTIQVAAQTGPQAIGNPDAPYRFAHVQVDAAGTRTARVLSGRRLLPGTDYVAVLVPAYDESGAPSWNGSAPVRLPAYDYWQFSTATPAGSFEDLAAWLRPGVAAATIGRAPMRYPRLADAPELEVLGALVAASPAGPATDGPLPAAVAEDLRGLRTPRRDDEGRPVVAIPRYGEAWSPAVEQATWARDLGRDPRRRGVAGLGLEIGIRHQEELVSDVIDHLGALQEARQRLGHLVLGVEAARSLWRRRIPTEQLPRLWLLGPALSRVVTDGGTVADLATAQGRTVARGTFSSAARRILRPGPPRSSPHPPPAILRAANRPPPPPPSGTDGVPLDVVDPAEFDRARRRVLQSGRVDPERLLAAATDLAGRIDQRVTESGGQMVTALRRATQLGRPVPWGQALPMLASADADVVGGRRDPAAAAADLATSMNRLRERFDESADDADLTELVAQFSASRADDPAAQPVDLGRLAGGVAAAFDPTVGVPPVAVRVLETIKGIDPGRPLAPPEPCVGLGRAVWDDVRRAFRDWLLPGVGQLLGNSVVALETNPVFTDTFLTGLNTQLLAELRWRNLPVATGCTPIRRFWDRADTASGARVDDIVGIASWDPASRLGDASHLAPGASSRDLVITVRGELFLRYPTTLVYLQSALRGGRADFDTDPDPEAPGVLPGFQGRLADDVTIFGFPGFPASRVPSHWLVFEEPPAGYRFANDVSTSATTGHAWAAAALVRAVRVLIRGDSLIAGGS